MAISHVFRFKSLMTALLLTGLAFGQLLVPITADARVHINNKNYYSPKDNFSNTPGESINFSNFLIDEVSFNEDEKTGLAVIFEMSGPSSQAGKKLDIPENLNIDVFEGADALHAQDTCAACDQMRAMLESGELDSVYSVSLPSASVDQLMNQLADSDNLSLNYRYRLRIPVEPDPEYNQLKMSVCNHDKVTEHTIALKGAETASVTVKEITPLGVKRLNVVVPPDGDDGSDDDDDENYLFEFFVLAVIICLVLFGLKKYKEHKLKSFMTQRGQDD